MAHTIVVDICYSYLLLLILIIDQLEANTYLNIKIICLQLLIITPFNIALWIYLGNMGASGCVEEFMV